MFSPFLVKAFLRRLMSSCTWTNCFFISWRRFSIFLFCPVDTKILLEWVVLKTFVILYDSKSTNKKRICNASRKSLEGSFSTIQFSITNTPKRFYSIPFTAVLFPLRMLMSSCIWVSCFFISWRTFSIFLLDSVLWN